jgi:hypothetical protein
MTFFHNFTIPVWKIFTGNLLLLLCSLFYLAWWALSFRPNSSSEASGGYFLMAAFITGITAIVLMYGGISPLSQDSKGFPVMFILLCIAALFVIGLLITTIAFHRIVTSELIIIHLWTALELPAIAVLYGTGHFGAVSAAVLTALVGIATVAALICYVLYYRLDGTARYWSGIIPLAVDALVAVVFMGMLAVFAGR